MNLIKFLQRNIPFPLQITKIRKIKRPYKQSYKKRTKNLFKFVILSYFLLYLKKEKKKETIQQVPISKIPHEIHYLHHITRQEAKNRELRGEDDARIWREAGKLWGSVWGGGEWKSLSLLEIRNRNRFESQDNPKWPQCSGWCMAVWTGHWSTWHGYIARPILLLRFGLHIWLVYHATRLHSPCTAAWNIFDKWIIPWGREMDYHLCSTGSRLFLSGSGEGHGVPADRNACGHCPGFPSGQDFWNIEIFRIFIV